MTRSWGAACLLVVVSVGCSGGRSTAQHPAEPVPQRPADLTAEQAVATFSVAPGGLEASFQTVNRLAGSRQAALRSAALAHLQSTDTGEQYAAVYALTLTAVAGPSMDALQAVLQTGNDSEQLLAATRLAVLGDREALSVIIGFLDSDASLSHWEPPIELWQFARDQLLALTDQDFGLHAAKDRAAAAATMADWSRWWADNGATYQLHARGVRLP